MKYSYFFNAEKSHRLEFSFEVQNYKALDNGNTEIVFIARVSEFINNEQARSESKTGTFVFAAGNKGHDVDLLRIRISEQDKWVFHVKNNKDASQDVIVGLITKTADANPLGEDIYHTSPIYDAELKGNNLAILEQSYQPPVLTQTLVYTTFATPEYPIGFSSHTATYSSQRLLYELKDFRQVFSQPIESHTAFSIEMNVAPLNTNTVGDSIFWVNVDGIGRFEAQKKNLVFVKEGDEYVNAVKIPLNVALVPELLYKSNSFMNASKLTISGNGIGKLTVTYAGKQFIVDYNAGQPIQFVELITQEGSMMMMAAEVALDEDITPGAGMLSSGDRIGIAGEWDANNAIDDNEVTAWGSIQGGNVNGLAWIGVDLKTPRQLRNISFRQSGMWGVDFLDIETSEDGNVWSYVESASTHSQDSVSIDLSVNAIARYWRLMARSAILSFPDNGEDWETRMVDESWIIYDLQMFEATAESLPAPSNLKAEVQPNNNVKLTWDFTGPADSSFRVYNQSVYLGVEVTGVNEALLTNLIESKEYQVQVSARSGNSISPSSETVSFTLDPVKIDWNKRVSAYVDNFIVKFYK